jgi:hypothetical protein
MERDTPFDEQRDTLFDEQRAARFDERAERFQTFNSCLRY